MDAAFLGRLPDSARPLVDRLERALGREVQVRPGTRPAGAIDAGSLWCVGPEAAIYYFEREHFTAQAAVHELLHLHRWWVERVPQLVPVETEGGGFRLTSQIENALEHLAIVPRERDYGFRPDDHWNAVASHTCTHPLPGWQPHLLAYLTVDVLVTDNAVKAMARRRLEREKLWGRAVSFAREVRRRLENKVELLKFVVPALGLPPADYLMMYLGPEDYAALS